MTGGPGLDREDSLGAKLPIAGGGERPKVGGREVRGNNQRWGGGGRLSKPGPCLGSAGQSRPGLEPCVRLGSTESARALSSKPPMVAWKARLAGTRLEPTQSPTPGPDWHGLVSGRPTRSQAGPASVLGNGRLRSGLVQQAGRRPLAGARVNHH